MFIEPQNALNEAFIKKLIKELPRKIEVITVLRF
jgi:hypothetical protein